MEKRKVLFTFGMSNDKIIIITDATTEALENWCRQTNIDSENGVNNYFNQLKVEYYVKVLHDSEIDDNENIETIGYDEVYDLNDVNC